MKLSFAKRIFFLTMALTLGVVDAKTSFAVSRIKDIADIEGVRENQLIGYGLVVGLNGTGDNIKSIAFTKESLISMLDRLGINSRDGQLKSKNIAAVMVTGSLPAFGRLRSSRMDLRPRRLGWRGEAARILFLTGIEGSARIRSSAFSGVVPCLALRRSWPTTCP